MTGIALAMVAGTSAADRGTKSRVTIETWPRGVFGYVKTSSPRCGKARNVIVFKQRSDTRKPSRDQRIGSAEARKLNGFYQWSLRTNESGRFYAKTRRDSGCAPAVSKTIRSETDGGGQVGGDGDQLYPDCSPWTREGSYPICYIDLHVGLRTYIGCKGFSSTAGSCDLQRAQGPYPWGKQPDGQAVSSGGFGWNWNDHGVLFFARRPGQDAGAAHIGGTMPGPSSADFTVTDAFAQNDAGYPNGEHFYTPNLPGQRAGEVGGPLYVDFEARSDVLTVDIHGYMYLKPVG